MENCIFCKIINNLIESEIVFEDENMIIINDISPLAKKHYLMIPKKHIANISTINEKDGIIISRMLYKLSQIYKDLGLINGYRLVINNGIDACQSVDHLHIHVLGGEKLVSNFNLNE